MRGKLRVRSGYFSLQTSADITSWVGLFYSAEPYIYLLGVISLVAQVQFINDLLMLHISSCFSFLRLDRVYRGDCSTREVYEGGTKDIALSVVSGINCEFSSHMPFTFCCRFPIHLIENLLL